MRRRSFLALTGAVAGSSLVKAEAAVEAGRPPSDRRPPRGTQPRPLGRGRSARDGLREPAARRSRRRGRAQGRGHLRRCRDRHERRARPDGAGELRHRRRPLRDPVGREGPQALRPERERPRARGLDAREGARSRPRAHPAPEPALLERTGLRQRLAGLERALRPARPRAPRRALDRVRARRLPGLAHHRLALRRLARRGQPAPGCGLPPRRPGPGLRRRVPEPALGGVLRAHRKGRRGRLLRGRDRRAHRREVARPRRLHEPRGPALAPRGLGGPGLVELPRLRRLGDPAERPGHLRAADPEPDGGLRRREPRPQLGRLPAPLRRGQEARLRGPRPLLRRPRLRQGPAGVAHLEGVRARAREEDRPQARGAPRGPRRPAARLGHRLPVRGRRRGQHGLVHPEQLRGLRLRHLPRRRGLRDAEPRPGLLARPRPPQPPRAEEAPVPHDHPGLPDAGTARP